MSSIQTCLVEILIVSMRKVAMTGFLGLCLALTTLAQNLPANFEFKRETGQETGVPVFILTPRTEAMSYDSIRGSTFEALGVLIQPERDKYGLIFYNAKKEYQLHLQKELGVRLKIDGEEFKIPEYMASKVDTVGLLRIELAAIAINRTIFEKLVKANDVVIRVGSVIYNLDRDNIDALHYCATEVEKDIARRKKPSEKVTVQSNTPRFKDYPVSEVYKGKNALLRLTSEDRVFRTRLKWAVDNQKPDFAGHYILTTWGCGALCLMGAAIDAKTGLVYWWNFTVCCWGFDHDNNFNPIEYRLNSALIVFSGLRNEKDGENGAHYYKFQNGRFVHIQSILSKEQL